MDSREKQNLMDEFGISDNGGAATESEQSEGPAAAVETPVEKEAQSHEFDPAAALEIDETTLTDGLLIDVIHDLGPDITGVAGERIGEDPLASELTETKDRLLRLAAEFENFKKRRIREREDMLKFANERLLKDFLPVLDNLERALGSANQSGQGHAITAGIELVIHEFLSILSREGVTPVDSVGKPFDPALQDALQQIETADVPPGTVAAEVLKGYLLNGRVLRAALVVVAREAQARE